MAQYNRDSRGRFRSRGGGTGEGGGIGDAGKTLGELLGAEKVFDKLVEGTKTLGEGLQSVTEKAAHLTLRLGEVGAAGAVAFATHGVVHLNAELEQTQIALGAIFQAQGYYKSFEAGFSRAGEEVAKMKKDVMQLPVTFAELRETMQMIATPASHAGASIEQIRTLAERTTLVAGILGVPQDLAAREMGQLLSGHMNSRNRLGIELGFEAKTFNAKTHEEQLKEITANFARFDDSANRFSQSFKTNVTSLKDNLLNFEGAATKGLFEHVKVTLAEANTWFDGHRQQVAALASLIDNRLSSAWTTIEKTVKSVSREVGPWLDKLLQMQPAAIGRKLEGMAETGLELKIAGMALKSLGGIGAAAGGGGEGAAAIGQAAIVAAPVVLGLAGAIHILRDDTLLAHTEAVKMSKDMGSNLAQAMRTLDKDTEGARTKLGQFVDQMGLVTIGAADLVAKGFNKLIQGMHAVGAAGERLGTRLLELFKTPEQIEAEKRFRDSVDGTPRAGDRDFAFHLLKFSTPQLAEEERKNLKQTPPNNTIMKVEIVVKGSDDPSRVARLTMEHLQKIARNPTRSPHVPDYSAPALR